MAASIPDRPRAAPDLLRATIDQNGGAWVTCVGASMEPTIPRGARLRVVAAPTVVPGDVVLFATSDGTLVTHRVIARLGGWTLHAGDGAAARPGLVRNGRILGRVLSPRRPPPLRARLVATVRAVRRVI